MNEKKPLVSSAPAAKTGEDMADAPQTILYSRMGREMNDSIIVDLMTQALANPDLLSLAAGFTDNAVMPKDLVGQIVSEMTGDEFGLESLQYGTNQGRPKLRELSCDQLAKHPHEVRTRLDADQVMMTNGSQQSLYLAVQTLCDPGDIILVEEPSYFVCLEMLKGLGVRAIGIPCDPEGAILPDAFKDLLKQLDSAGERSRVKAAYLVSYFSNPSSRSMLLAEKQAVAEVLLEADFYIPVIEDGAYRELFYESPHSVPSIMSLSAFDSFPRLYLGTYTKPFATGLKVGYGVCSDDEWRHKMLCVKGHQDFGSANFNQCLMERILESGLYEGHLEKVRAHYAQKAERVGVALEASGIREAGWKWTTPAGGLLYWLRGPETIDTRMKHGFCNACIDQGVLYVPGDLCLPSGAPHNCLRLSFGALPENKLDEAVSRFVKEALQWSV